MTVKVLHHVDKDILNEFKEMYFLWLSSHPMATDYFKISAQIFIIAFLFWWKPVK